MIKVTTPNFNHFLKPHNLDSCIKCTSTIYESLQLVTLDGIWPCRGPRVPLCKNARTTTCCRNMTWLRDCHVRFSILFYFIFPILFCIFSILFIYLFIYFNNLTSGTTRGTGVKRPSPCPKLLRTSSQQLDLLAVTTVRTGKMSLPAFIKPREEVCSSCDILLNLIMIPAWL